MLAAMRPILDESSASFWTDAEAYAALADGQNEVIKAFLGVYRAKRKVDPTLPYELESLLNDNVGAVDAVAVPSGFLELISATYDHDGTGGQVACYISNMQETQFNEENTFLTATANSPVAYVKSTTDAVKINFLPALSGTPAYTYWCLVSPTDIASGQNATLPVTTHSAIVNYATARMLEKDQRQESQVLYNKYLQELKMILGI